MQYSEVFVWFSIYGSKFDPDEITAQTGITPGKTWRKGDQGPTPTMVRPRNGWIVESRLTRVDTLEDQVNDVMEQIGWETSKLLEIEDGERMLGCAIYMYDCDRPPGHVTGRAVQVCGALRAAIDIDLYPFSARKE